MIIAYAIFLLLALSLATPLPGPAEQAALVLKTRGTGTRLLVMVDCTYNGLTYSSICLYYDFEAKGANGQLPDDLVDFTSKVTWEGKTWSEYYADNGYKVSVSISANGKSLAKRDPAGTAQEDDSATTNTFVKKYSCYKDNGHKLFAITGGEVCYSQYFCQMP